MCSLNLSLSFLPVCPTYCIPQLGARQVMTYITIIEFHVTLLEKRQLKVLLFTKEEIVLPVLRNLQHKHLLVLHFVTCQLTT